MCSTGCAKSLLVAFNFIFWLGGAALLGFGIWMKLDPTIVNYLFVVNVRGTDPLLSHAALVFIVAGGVVFLTGFCGCFGALREHQGLIFLYAVVLLVIMAAEIVGGVLVLIYRSKIENSLKKEMLQQIQLDTKANSSTMAAWNFLQVKNGSAAVPDTCCVTSDGSVSKPQYKDKVKCQSDASKQLPQSDFYNVKGCYPSIKQWFDMHSLIMMLLGFAVGGFQILVFVAACCLRRSLRNKPAENKFS